MKKFKSITLMLALLTAMVMQAAPFEAAGSFDAAKAYYLQINPNTSNYCYLNGTSVANGNLGQSEAYMWKFVGNDTEGYQIYNVSAGNTKVLYSANTNSAPTMVALSTLSASANTRWDITESTYGNAGGFYVSLHGNSSAWLNRNGGTGALTFWSGKDAGSTFHIEEATPVEPSTIQLSTDTEKHYYTLRNGRATSEYAYYVSNSDYMGTRTNPDLSSLFYFTQAGAQSNGFTPVNIHNYAAADVTLNDWNVWGATTATTWYIKDGVSSNSISIGTQAVQNNSTRVCWNRYDGSKIAGWSYYQGGSNTVDTGSEWFFEEVNPDDFLTEVFAVSSGTRPTDISPLSLWYDVPATKTGVANPWMEYGLPIGNGQIGGVLFGGILKDEIQFNEKTMYNGSPTDYGEHGKFVNFGSIIVTDLSNQFSLKDNSSPVRSYARYLDIQNGVGGVKYTNASKDTQYERKYITSAPHKVLAAHYTATGENKLNLRFAVQPDGAINATAVTYSNAGATFGGKLKTVDYNAQFRVVADADATITTTTTGIVVSNATQATLYLAAGTNFDDSTPSFVKGTRAQVAANNTAILDEAVEAGWEKVYADHVDNFSELMGRVTLQLGSAASKRTTKELIDLYATAANRTKADGLFLEQLHFQYGRYLEISTNNILINAPSNLQGIWNNWSETSFWHCDVHADVNVQMNYWPAEPTNLSQMHLPFLNNIITLGQDNYNFHKLAQRVKSGARGWMSATECNIFGGTSTWMVKEIQTPGAWNCSHLWQHYRYTLDKDFLRRAFPSMLRAAWFLIDICTAKHADGTYYVPNQWSPEHGPYTYPTAFAQQNINECLTECLSAIEELGRENVIAEGLATAANIAELEEWYAKIDRGLNTEIFEGKECLSEWKGGGLNAAGDAHNHRHLNHLMALYPYNLVSAYDNTEEGKRLFNAAKNSLHVRNSRDITGWSMGWKMNLYARTLEGNMAHDLFDLVFHHSGSYTIQMSGQGGVYYNLWDAHSPFQIDGNFGYTAGVAEMLMQSYNGNVNLLPALPTAWRFGSVTGLKAIGDFTVDIKWSSGALSQATITNNQGQPLNVTASGLELSTAANVYVNGEQIDVIDNPDGSFGIPSQKGDVITITPGSGNPSGVKYHAAETPPVSTASYDLQGRPFSPVTGSNIVIAGGKKYLKK